MIANTYAKVIVKGSPISKSNFKLFNVNGQAILPVNSGKYHDRYAIYEEEIALEARIQNPDVVLTEGLIAILKVYYKNKKRHPDTNNIPKSIFDGIEKSGLIVNDAQIKHLIIEENYDKENPRFELELFCESEYSMNYNIIKREIPIKAENYNPPPNKKKTLKDVSNENTRAKSSICATSIDGETNASATLYLCQVCGKKITKANSISANKGKTHICKNCFKDLF
ncbi:RusA family crossover junction endodeoxyribonuclease [Clostridium cellulovorans]|uniref:Endodeoxyribonuclease RusA n=1 Tax=Clostridium cellulovorans (strain ATCC 35296 / DSM 3052 / OCM 3 / 743B) TaxID=573061 RepID=D9ST24_CLOC7|nr:RusA family crossover junction endodeoxyribonuclease [Clostridium cellulovorans]ADL52686.1 endodeoxyribonuclease RusA [Clostridium cellulovorans 743B]